MFKTGRFEDKNEIVECSNELSRYHKLDFWGYRNITADAVKCVKFHGLISDLKRNLNPSTYR